jgi:hypothetical protein
LGTTVGNQRYSYEEVQRRLNFGNIATRTIELKIYFILPSLSENVKVFYQLL